MRPIVIATLTVLAAVLASCGKRPVAPPDASAPPAETSAAAPAAAPTALTDAPKTAALGSLPAAFQHADMANGEAKFALCKTCHTVVSGGANMIGPNLYGVFGRKAGTAPGFSYSEGLKASGIVWDAVKLDQWIANPRAIVAGTKMSYAGMEDAKDRTDVIAYLKVATTGPGS